MPKSKAPCSAYRPARRLAHCSVRRLPTALSTPVAGRRQVTYIVFLHPKAPGQFLEISASREGAFAYRMVTPGNYRVLAFKNPQRDLPYRDADAMKVYETKGRVVHFSPGQKVSLQLEVISRAE